MVPYNHFAVSTLNYFNYCPLTTKYFKGQVSQGNTSFRFPLQITILLQLVLFISLTIVILVDSTCASRDPTPFHPTNPVNLAPAYQEYQPAGSGFLCKIMKFQDQFLQMSCASYFNFNFVISALTTIQLQIGCQRYKSYSHCEKSYEKVCR